MELYKILSVLLVYPEEELINSLQLIRERLKPHALSASLDVLLAELENEELIDLQEGYVQTFDRTPGHSLHLFEHIHGEDRLRGQALANLLEEYEKAGFHIASRELPDYLPLFLEFLSTRDEAQAQELLGAAIDVIAHVGKKLDAAGSCYAGIFHLLETCSPIKPQTLTAVPVRDMDDLIEQMGISSEGQEPLLPFGRMHCHAENMCKEGGIT